VARANWLRPGGPGGGLASDAGGRRLVRPAGSHLSPNCGDVLVKLGGTRQVTSSDAIQSCLSDLVRQPQGDGRQRDRSLWS
jgi:hypothetical protein